MKKMLLLIVFIGYVAFSQNSDPYQIFENVTLTPNPEKINALEKNLAEHNKKYHADDVYGCRVYSIVTGPDTGKIVWSMGPITWGTIDNRPKAEDGHDNHWNTMVMPNLLPEANTTYWKALPEYSNFPKNFKLDKLDLTYYDVKRGFGNFEKIKEILGKIAKMNKEKYPDDVYGVYANEFGSTSEGRDLVFVYFFENSSKLGEQDDQWISNYNEVNGEGSFDKDVKTWYELTNSSERELWILSPELSGKSAEVIVENQ